MANSFGEVITMITKIIKDTTRYNVPRLGKIAKTDDPLKRGRILVHIPSLGWDTDDKGAWCYPKDKNSLVTPKKDMYVLVEFVDGDRDLPIYSGIATQMKNMLPANYDGNKETQIVFESNNQGVLIKALESAKELLVQAVTKAVLSGGGLEIELTATGIVLKSGDATLWKPCIIPNCIMTGAPHGGAVGGIIKLSGG